MKHLEIDLSKCVACKNCEKECSETFFKQDNRELSAIRVIVQDGKAKEIKACNQCGMCMDVCPTQAIKRTPKGTVLIDKRLCVGCLSCIGFCPTLDMHQNKEELVPFKCIACGACVKVCTGKALTIVE